MNKAFREYVTSAAFSLTLSKKMILELWLIEQNKVGSAKLLMALRLTDTTVPTRCRLEARGLIVSHEPEWPGAYKLTKEGRLICELLKLAGLFNWIEEAL